MSENTLCGWRCGDETPGHDHYTVIVRENGKLLGRLCPDGTATNRKVFASILSRATADRIAGEINEAGNFQAKVARF